MRGFGSILNIFPSIERKPRRFKLVDKSDAEAIAEDWETVLGDWKSWSNKNPKD